jgi:glycosyltransferase involved in cell wall biosynthesis
VHNFLQFASVIKLFNPSTTICLGMQSEWLTQFATATNERRLSPVDLITGCSDYITEGIGRPARLLFVGRLSPEKGVHVLI